MPKVVHNEGDSIVMPAGADLTAAQYLCVKNDGSGNAVLATAGTDVIIGTVKIPAPSSSSPYGEVEIFPRSSRGTILAVAGGTITPGAAVTATTGGKVIATTTSGDQIVGYFVRAKANAASNDIIEIMPSTAKY